MALRGNELFLSYGVMGGFMQVSFLFCPLRDEETITDKLCWWIRHKPQGHVQVLLNLLRGFTPQAALDAPRFCISAGSPETEDKASGDAGDINSEVYLEEGISEEVLLKLKGASDISRPHSSWYWSIDTESLFVVKSSDMGHDTRRASGFQRSMLGRGQVIQRIIDENGERIWAAGSDPRADGHAAAQIW